MTLPGPGMGPIQFSISALLFLALLAGVWLMVRTIRQDRAGKRDRYPWQPEQDYDVEFDDGGPMTPPWPTMKKRERRDMRDDER